MANVSTWSSTSKWRRQEQLRGQQVNHASTIGLLAAPLSPAGTLLGGCCLAVPHGTRTEIAVALSPMLQRGSSLLGVANVSNDFTFAARATPRANIFEAPDFSSSVRWQESAAAATSLAWAEQDALLLVGRPQGTVDVLSAGSIADAPIGQLRASHAGRAVATITTQPSEYAATTDVRCLQSNRSTARVSACCGAGVDLWDLDGGPSPQSTFPVGVPDPETAVCCAWADANILGIGGIAGSAHMVDVRTGARATALPAPPEFCVRALSFSPTVPFAAAIGSSNDTLSIIDTRFVRSPVLTIEAMQQGPTSLLWLPTYADMLASAGADGTVKFFNLRCAPSYLVGCAALPSAVVALTSPSRNVSNNALGMCADGTLFSAFLQVGALGALAPASSEGHVFPEERGAEEALYRRDIPALVTEIIGVARAHEKAGRLDRAWEVCAMLDPVDVPAEVPLLGTVLHLSQRIPKTALLDGCTGYVPPSADDLRKIDALRLNISLRRCIKSSNLTGLNDRLPLLLETLRARPDLIETEVLTAAARLLLSGDMKSGSIFLQRITGILVPVIEAEGGDGAGDVAEEAMPHRCRVLLQSLLLAASEPLITDGTNAPPKKVRIMQRRFVANAVAAAAAVEAQLRILEMEACGSGPSLSAGIARQIVAAVAKYQTGALSTPSEVGIFGWIAARPILLYLRALLASGNTVAFFWTAHQLLDTWATAVGSATKAGKQVLSEIDTLIDAEVGRLAGVAQGLQYEVGQLTAAPEVSAGLIRASEALIKKLHPTMLLLARLWLGIEAVAVDNGMDACPPLVQRVVDAVSEQLNDTTTSWGELLHILSESRLTSVVRSCCAGPVSELLSAVESLNEETPSETFEAIIAVANDFLTKTKL